MKTIKRGGTVLCRGGDMKGVFTGGSRPCPPNVCGSKALGIRWEDGSLTFVCERQIAWKPKLKSHQLV